MPRERSLHWPALVNARDLGGLPARAGRTRFGAAVRSDSLARLTEAGLAAMRDYGVSTAVDLRAPRERARPPSPVQDWSGYRARPVFDDAALACVEERFRDDSTGFYVWALESRPEAIAAIFRAIADAPPGAVVISCEVGKDRTGIVAALLLALAGVDRDAIVSDFMLSEGGLAGLADAEPDPVRRAQLRSWYRPEPELLTDLLDRLDESYGSAGDPYVAE